MKPTAEIIAIGSELLSGYIVDTNSSHISRVLSLGGIQLSFISAVGDDEEVISAIVTSALSRSDIVFTTGGLGPTIDDKTRASVALATNRQLVFEHDLLMQIESRFSNWGRKMSKNNMRQAYMPDGAIPIENPVGTAPCFIVEHDQSRVICLPGVPREMKYILDHEVMPYLARVFPSTDVIKTRVLYTVGVGESVVDSKIGHLEEMSNPVVGLAAHQGIVDIRITATGSSEKEADQLICSVEEETRAHLGDVIFGADGQSLASVVLGKLENSGHTLSVVESGTSGDLARKLVVADNGKGVFQAGILLSHFSSNDNCDVERDMEDMIQSYSTNLESNFVIASAVYEKENDIVIGVALFKSDDKSMITKARGFGGHVKYAGEWAANVGLNLLRDYEM
ncbi:MAG: competence/damage-inducible protein A [Chloroflexi bacterium]|nr:competence/damage-inducible protein A [Chloroflexota bacterium]